jgi:hypothetical protein
MERLTGLDESMTSEAALTVASQLQALGQPGAANGVLRNCAEIYGDDPKVMQKIATQTDDPEILGANQLATDLNLQGVRSYKGGDLPQAQDLFSIALNLAQSLLPGKGQATDVARLQECQACLRKVGKMPETDARYERFQKLQSRAFQA